MSNLKLTKQSVETLAVKEKDYIRFDTDLTGFGIRVMPSGKRFFLIQYRRQGRTRRFMIGQFGPITVECARREAQRMLGAVRGGGSDRADRRDQLRQSMTVRQLGERFFREHVEVRCKSTTQVEYKRSVDLFINPFFGDQRVLTVTSADIADLHGSYAHIPYQANRTLGVLSKMMSLAELWGIRDKHTNPCEGVKRYPERKRERFLSLTELHKLGRAFARSKADGTENSYAIAAFRLLLLTGCRLSEIQKLQWRHADLDQAQINLPDSKTGKRAIHLGNAAVVLLANLPRVNGNPYVIIGKVSGQHLTDLQRPWRRIRKAAGLEGVRIHDLRHTFASGGLLVGESLPVIGKLLGHTQVQTTARYAHLATDPLKAAATKISDRLAAAML